MIIFPAIDILSGRPVRLIQGDYDQASQVADSIVETAQSFEKAGSEWIHMVDLDGAKAGHPVNHEYILETVRTVGIPIEIGGGIRTEADARLYLDGGVGRVILGTAALQDEHMLRSLVKDYPGKIAVSLDAKDGRVKVAGWLEDGGVLLDDAVKQMEDAGVKTLIVTDIRKDGMLQGPSFALMEHLSALTDCDLVASGGVSSLKDIEQLADMDLYGAIAGKALYSGALDLEQAIAAGRKAGQKEAVQVKGEKTC